ncbi:hypothetical protein EVAR_63420_1 [Eumeta japonica]|uniref:Uncharacterized protein n=1 Tax=Eumeta variegata TaxID=151549 RepID=A0A4C1ZSZ0_EUMVA|nr:hypothetical protein EVAR_63420_1 [Eumeta japonica]
MWAPMMGLCPSPAGREPPSLLSAFLSARLFYPLRGVVECYCFRTRCPNRRLCCQTSLLRRTMSSPGVYFILFVFIGDVARLETRLERGSLSRLVFTTSEALRILFRTALWLGPVLRRCLINRLLFVRANNRRPNRPAEFSELDGQGRAGFDLTANSSSIRARSAIDLANGGTEDGVRDDGGGRATPGIGEEHPQGRWSQVRPGLPFPEGQRQGSLLQITSLTPLVVECGGRQRRTADSRSAGPEGSRGGDLHKKRIA